MNLTDAAISALSGTSGAPGATLLALGQALKARGYHFTTVTPATHQRIHARDQARLAQDLAGVFGWNRPFESSLLEPELLRCMADAGVVGDRDGNLCSKVRASTLDGQLYWHSGFPTSAQDAVFFGPDTYRFLRALNQEIGTRGGTLGRAVDLGCGSGAGAIAIALAHPEATVFAVDINQAALDLTEVNAQLAAVDNVRPVMSDLLTALDGSFDMIVSNPPYLLDREQRAYRHGGGDLGAGLSLAVVEQAIARLSPGGVLLLYTGVAIVANRDPFRAAVEPMLAGAGFTWRYEEIDPDVFGEELDESHYAHADRIAAVWLWARKPEAQRST
jgi:methylase of polypeptide subunit release factors